MEYQLKAQSPICSILAPFGETSVIKTAAPLQKELLGLTEWWLTKEPKIIGGAPEFLTRKVPDATKRKSNINAVDKESR